MDKTILVSADFDIGAEILKILDGAKVVVSVALWVYSSEYEDWRLALSSRQLDSVEPREAYRLIHNSLAKSGFVIEKTPPLMIFRMTDPFIRELRRLFGRTRSVEGMRVGGQMIGDRFVEDAYIYRIS
jgi:hypothetical protein